MHNLLLGITKKMAVCWTSRFKVNGAIVKAVLGNDELRSMQKSLEEGMLLPPSHATSSIAKKLTIGSGFSKFKADEWATWLLVLSPYLLVDKLDNQKFSHWMLFISAARVLLSPSLSLAELDEAHDKLRSFLAGIVPVYGDKTLITANCHYAMHIRETIIDYSASPNHWLFNFERYNQDVKNIRTNRKD